tara:strand:- start:34171 stop:34872 length:702 start_codon:yes stop_codon:yes gene_type:complete
MKLTPWFSYPFLLTPKRIMCNLARRQEAKLISGEAPNAWQLSLGVMRMWHRSLFRTETVGTSPTGTVRSNWRAALLHNRTLRLPFLLMEGAVAPFDMTGLASDKERIIKHLLGAHHDGNQFIFDIDLLLAHEGALEELRVRASNIVETEDRRSTWLRDLTVFEGYHESLLAAVDDALERGISMSEKERWDADLSLSGYLSWCAQQPATPVATLQAIARGNFAFDSAPTKKATA